MAASADLEGLLRRGFSGTVLDAGSGAGSTLDDGSRITLESHAPALLVQVDRECVTPHACASRLRADLDASGLPFGGEVFTGAVCNHVLEHLHRPRQLLEELHRVLRAESPLVTAVPNGWSFSDNLYRAWKGLFRILKGEPIPHVQRFSKSSFCQLLEQSGFEVVSISSMGETYEWLSRHRVARFVLTKMTHFLRVLDPEFFSYGWHAVVRRRP